LNISITEKNNPRKQGLKEKMKKKK